MATMVMTITMKLVTVISKMIVKIEERRMKD